jgi:hypothetical protein
VRVNIKEKFKYPFPHRQVIEMRLIAKKFMNTDVGKEDE